MSRRKNDAFNIDDMFELLRRSPVWLGPFVAVSVFAGLRWVLPWSVLGNVDSGEAIGRTFWPAVANFSVMISWWAAGGILLVWIFAEIVKRIDKARFEAHTGLSSIRELDWQEFEHLLTEVFQRQGYSVRHVGSDGPDGGVDHRLTKDGQLTLVQCKQWRNGKNVSVTIVRELLGVMTSELASAGIVVTSGGYTPDAIEFARKNPITLIDGSELARLVRSVQANPTSDQSLAAEPSANIVMCPKCGSAMAQRTARKGLNAGTQFWGCTNYPRCRGTR